MSMNRHDHFEELISASLAGDLSDVERQELDAHLDSCAACRATLASFADQRRIMAGLRHVAPPRDLGARVRSGVEAGAHGEVPWWRRPLALAGLGGGLAAVAGALLAIVLLNGSPDDQQVGGGSESPAASLAVSPAASAPTPDVAASPSSTEPSASPVASPIPEPSPDPDVYLAYTGPVDNLALMLRDGRTGEPIGGLEATGPPIAAELSPNGQFLAYITQLGQSGRNEVWVVHLGSDVSLRGAEGAVRVETPLAEWESVRLGESVAGSPFLEVMSWSPDSGFLAYTMAGAAGDGTDVWLFEAASGTARQLTDTGGGYAGSWLPRVDGAMLWVSVAGEQPVSHLVDVSSISSSAPLADPGAEAIFSANGAFQPLVSPDGARAIYWQGVMTQSGNEWLFSEGGAPYIGGMVGFDGAFEFTEPQPLFSDVTVERDAFTDAAITWGADGDAYAVWRPRWTGTPQGAGGEYPNFNRVYFGHASDARGLTELHAIDEGDIPQDAAVVDVKVPTGRHLLITALEPIGGILSVPLADLILVTRNTGDVPDEVEPLAGAGGDGWFGPGAYDAYWDTSAP
ncbi:MAG: zf-HC2 domain-containing protein [Chloroflexota bacterium]